MKTIGKYLLLARAAVGTVLLAAATFIMPRPLDKLLFSYLEAAPGLANEIANGRTFGVITAVWGFNQTDYSKGLVMQGEAMRALTKTRLELEQPDESAVWEASVADTR